MTLAEIRTLVQIYVEDTGTYTPTVLDNLINRAYERIVQKLDSLDFYYKRRSEEVTLSESMTLTASWRKLLGMIDLDTGHKIRIIDPREWPQPNSTDVFAYLEDTAIKLFDDAPNSNVYTVFYSPALVTNEFDHIPSEYHDIIALRTNMRIGSLEKGRMQLWQIEYNEAITDLVNSHRNVVDGPQYVAETLAP